MEPALSSSPRPEVLLAEDDEGIRGTLQSLLDLKGYAVTVAGNTGETTNLLEQREFDLLITDYLMPGGGGREILRFMRESGKRPRVIMMTGLSDDQLYRELTSSGVDRCLTKPFRLASLLETIEEVLALD